MNKKTHIALAVLIFLVAWFLYRWPFAYVIFSIAGALIPDLDLVLTKSLHRTWSHSLLTLALLNFLASKLQVFDAPAMLIFSLGFISHLLGDSYTKRGVNWLWPLPWFKFSGPVSTGRWSESVIAFFIFVAIAIALVSMSSLL